MIYDLSLPINEKTPVFPNDSKQEIRQVATVGKEGFNEKRVSFNTHFSTHIDFPSHMLKEGKTLSDFPIEKFVGEGVVLDARNKDIAEISLNYVKKNDFVFFCTGHISKVYSKDFFKDAPVLSEEFAQKLVKKQVSIIGLDSYTPDHEPYKVHKILLRKNILIIENLANLDKLVNKRFKCYVAPLKIENSDGAPCRVIAITD